MTAPKAIVILHLLGEYKEISHLRLPLVTLSLTRL
jgi:hypothetical protein